MYQQTLWELKVGWVEGGGSVSQWMEIWLKQMFIDFISIITCLLDVSIMELLDIYHLIYKYVY